MITTLDLVYWGTTTFLLGLLIVAGWACAIYIFGESTEPEVEPEPDTPSALVVAIEEHLASRGRAS